MIDLCSEMGASLFLLFSYEICFVSTSCSQDCDGGGGGGGWNMRHAFMIEYNIITMNISVICH